MATTHEPDSPTGPDLSDPDLYINRELSWLDFNERVLALADDPRQPLLERCKFLAIFSSNLDEFFMVRVAGHQDALEAGRGSSTPDRIPRAQLLDAIATRAQGLIDDQSEIWADRVRPALAEVGLPVVGIDDLASTMHDELHDWFLSQVYPALTPLAIGPGLPFPYISGLSLNLGLLVRSPETDEVRFARVKVPPALPRLFETSGGYVWLEDTITHYLSDVFPGMSLEEIVQFRVTRDADIDISMDQAEDLLGAVEDQLRRRRFGHAVRIELDADATPAIIEQLRGEHDLEERDVYPVSGPKDMTGLWALASLDRPELREKPWRPRVPPRMRGSDHDEVDIFGVIRRGDLLVHHPYDDFEATVQRFVIQAADDPDVLAIKQTVYRTTADSPIINALMRAAAAGKQTVCLVELQARFDEERNIQQAKLLERAGVHVVYGRAGRKTHAKLSLVIRREGSGVRRYVHVGTGNYNSTTARLYTDMGLLTCRDDITEDVSDLFNHLTGFRTPPRYRAILVAPDHVRDALIGEIDRVAAAAEAGAPARVMMKINALIDGPVIHALYRASRAGVQVDLVVRGICGLRPGLEGVSENIRVISAVGRFLEHSRLFAFIHGDDARYYLGSADMMVRNLDNRVEVITPVENPAARREVRAILDLHWTHVGSAWSLGPDGRWQPPRGNGDLPDDIQTALMERTAARDLDAGVA